MENNILEKISEVSRSGFDTKGDFIKNVGILPTIIIVAILVGGFYYLLGSVFTATRNCIGSISGAPECSDCSTKLINTTLNGRSLGKCTANPGTGKYDDQCTLNCSK